jgi:hypothetical protein
MATLFPPRGLIPRVAERLHSRLRLSHRKGACKPRPLIMTITARGTRITRPDHRRAVGVLDLEPVPRRPGPIGRTQSLRYERIFGGADAQTTSTTPRRCKDPTYRRRGGCRAMPAHTADILTRLGRIEGKLDAFSSKMESRRW